MMLLEPPPTPPCWPAYPEPERSRLEASYRREHAAYCERIDRTIKREIWVTVAAWLVGAGMALVVIYVS